MKILWAAMLGWTAAAWSFEGDWSTWDKTQGVEDAAVESRAGGMPGGESGDMGVYDLRALGRGESRWMGTLDGQSPSLADLGGKSRFDWTRWLGRAEAHHIDGSSRTAPYLTSGRGPLSEPLAGKEMGCNLIEANRAEGRDEAREVKVRQGGTGAPATTWEMDEESERKAAAQAAGNQDC